jgi:FkbM family methyltransferase
MTNPHAITSLLDPDGFNELVQTRSGPMVYNKHDIYVGGSLAKYGEFSASEQHIFQQLIRPGMVVVEAGANIGAHTIELAKRTGPDGEVHAFEPQRIVFQTLCANLALNQCTNVFARQAAVGDVAGSILVPAMDPTTRTNFGGVSLVGAAIGELVPVVTIDSLDLPICHLIKVDVEGMEAEVLRGARSTIATYRPILYVENDRVEKSEELLTLIQQLGYASYWHLAQLFNPNNFAGDPEDIFPGIVSINVLCVPAEANMQVGGLRPVTSPRDSWRTPSR